jgi:hypothetical protein
MGDTASMFYALSPRTVPKDLSQGPPSPMLCPQGPVMLCPQGPSVPKDPPQGPVPRTAITHALSPRTGRPQGPVPKDRQGPPRTAPRTQGPVPRLPARVQATMPRLARLVLSREVISCSGDFPNASLFDRPVNNARGWDGS